MEIVPGIHQVDGVNGNCYIIVHDSLTIIDTGVPGSGPKILAYIRDQVHRDPAGIRTIILTHFHMDHTGGIVALKGAAPGAKLAVHEGDSPFVSGTSPLPRYRGVTGLILRFFEKIKPITITPDILLNDGDIIDGLRCVHIPGHTPGSIGLLDEGSMVFFSGDILRFDGKSISQGPAQFTMDPDRERESIRRIAGLGFGTMLAGHGMPLRPDASARVRDFAATLPP
jgi:glyoxylase-like metal-dependent hydrolase (beta-lactamase superfamily II)